MTLREFYNIIINGNGTVTDKNEDGTKAETRSITLMNEDGTINPEIIAYAQTSVDKLTERNANRKASKSELAKAEERNSIANQIYELMENERTYTCGEISAVIGKNTQSLTPILTRMVDEGRIERIDNFKPAKGKSRCKGYVKK